MANLPIATIVADETMETANEYKDICEKVKHIRYQVSEFYETESELIEAINPIEQDPQSFTSGKPILKKYAHALLEKMEHERQLEAEEEAKQDKHLTPQQVKADLKHYVSTCEKKIVRQQEQCDQLQKQVEQLMDVVKVLVTYPHHPYQSLLTHCALVDTKSLDYFIQNLEIEGPHTSSLHYAIDSKNIESVKKLLDAGSDVNYNDNLMIYNTKKQTPEHKYEQGKYTPLEIASRTGSLEIVKLLIERGASITLGTQGYKVPNGPEGDLVAGYLQTHGSKPVTRF